MYMSIKKPEDVLNKKFVMVTNDINTLLMEAKENNTMVGITLLKKNTPVLYSPYYLDIGDIYSKDASLQMSIKEMINFELLVEISDIIVNIDPVKTNVVRYYSTPEIVENVSVVDDLKKNFKTTFCKIAFTNGLNEIIPNVEPVAVDVNSVNVAEQIPVVNNEVNNLVASVPLEQPVEQSIEQSEKPIEQPIVEQTVNVEVPVNTNLSVESVNNVALDVSTSEVSSQENVVDGSAVVPANDASVQSVVKTVESNAEDKVLEKVLAEDLPKPESSNNVSISDQKKEMPKIEEKEKNVQNENVKQTVSPVQKQVVKVGNIGGKVGVVSGMNTKPVQNGKIVVKSNSQQPGVLNKQVVSNKQVMPNGNKVVNNISKNPNGGQVKVVGGIGKPVKPVVKVGQPVKPNSINNK